MGIASWLEQRRFKRHGVRDDALALMKEYAGRAYEEARRRARVERFDGTLSDRPAGHWEKVRVEVGRLQDGTHAYAIRALNRDLHKNYR